VLGHQLAGLRGRVEGAQPAAAQDQGAEAARAQTQAHVSSPNPSKKKRSQCDCDKEIYFDSSLCRNALVWLHISAKKQGFEQFNYHNQKQKYLALLRDCAISEVQQREIAKDVLRTYPSISFFSSPEDEG
jgi:hypothetical protein